MINDQKCLTHTFLPELGYPRRGKVRDIYEKDDLLILITSDRLSIFDRILTEPLQDKGRILTELSCYWFKQTKDITPNHLIQVPDTNVVVVKKCHPYPVEIIVRAHLVGSLYRDYATGKRLKCGVKLPEGLKYGEALPSIIVTPTLKGVKDEDISKSALINEKIITKEEYHLIETLSCKLFARGRQLLKKKGIQLLDTKYEFGVTKTNELTLIDEIHTPDSSRFFSRLNFALDKEYVRDWAKKMGFTGLGPLPKVPDNILKTLRQGYHEIYKIVLGAHLSENTNNIGKRLCQNLKLHGLIKGYFLLAIIEAEDKNTRKKLTKIFDDTGIPYAILTYPVDDLTEYYHSLEPILCFAASKRIAKNLQKENFCWPLFCLSDFANPQETIYHAIEQLKKRDEDENACHR